MILAGPIDWDLDGLVPDLVKLALIVLGAGLLVLVTAGVLLAAATVGLTHLRRPLADGTDDDGPDELDSRTRE